MKHSTKRILPILLVIVTILSILWYLFIYDRDFTRDMLLHQARLFESYGQHSIASWLYDQAYRQADNNDAVAIELAQQFKENENYTKAEATLSKAIAESPTAELYIALCKTYVEQDKLLDAVTMLDHVSDPAIKAQLDSLRPAAPQPDQAPGFYSQYITVTLQCSGGTIYASNNGEYPSTQKDLYTDGIPLVAGENTIYAVCVGDNGLVSQRATLGYQVGGVIEEVKLENSELDALVREMLGLTADDRLLTSSLWNITKLSVPSSMTDLTQLQLFPYLTELTIENGNFADLQILSKLTQLQTLTVTGAPVGTQDLAVIATLPGLTRLTLSGCSLSSIKNLSGAQQLTYLDLSSNAIRDLNALSFISSLETLNLSHNALVNLSALSALKALRVLDVSYNSLASMLPLGDCTALEELDISNNTIGSLEGIEALTGLVKLNAGFNDLTEATPLTELTELVELTLSNNTLLNINCLSLLAELQYLDISHNEIDALPEWEQDCALVHINGSHNKIESLWPLAAFQNLNTVLMDYNAIYSVDALADCPNLIRVDVSGNPVKDVSKLTEQSIIVNYDPV